MPLQFFSIPIEPSFFPYFSSSPSKKAFFSPAFTIHFLPLSSDFLPLLWYRSGRANRSHCVFHSAQRELFVSALLPFFIPLPHCFSFYIPLYPPSGGFAIFFYPTPYIFLPLLIKSSWRFAEMTLRLIFIVSEIRVLCVWGSVGLI